MVIPAVDELLLVVDQLGGRLEIVHLACEDSLTVFGSKVKHLLDGVKMTSFNSILQGRVLSVKVYICFVFRHKQFHNIFSSIHSCNLQRCPAVLGDIVHLHPPGVHDGPHQGQVAKLTGKINQVTKMH